MQKVIAVCGKGGVGKTALTAMLTRQLKKRADTGRLLVVDADPALGLLYALNVETDKTIGAVRDKVLAAAESGNAGAQAEVANELDYLITSTLLEEDGYSAIAMGRMNAKGCFCSVNDLLKDALEQLVLKFDTIVVDGEAGLEQINRQVVEKINTLILVTDSSIAVCKPCTTSKNLLKTAPSPIVRASVWCLIAYRATTAQPMSCKQLSDYRCSGLCLTTRRFRNMTQRARACWNFPTTRWLWPVSTK